MTLTLHAYCGMAIPYVKSNDFNSSYEDCRGRAAQVLRRFRRRTRVSVMRPGFEWEIECPEDAFMVPDWAGILEIN